MKQVKIINKKDRFQIEIHCNKTQTVSQRDADLIQRGLDGNFLPFELDSGGSTTTLVYRAKGLLTLPDFLKISVLSKRMFLYIVRQYLHFDKQLEQNHFKKNAVLYRGDCILIDPATWHVYFVYVPVQPFEGEGSIRQSLQELIRYASFDPGEDTGYVQEYIGLVGNDVTFSLYLLDDFVKKNDGKAKPESSGISCRSCGYALAEDDVFCPMCGILRYPQSVKKEKSDLPVQSKSDWIEEEKTSDPGQTYTVNRGADGVVMVFKAPDRGRKKSVFLIQGSRTVLFSRFPFRIGKEADAVDYRIRNSAVSRKHADIILEQGAFFLVDLGSTNGTFLNGRRLQTGVKEVLHSGDTIRFAVEDYTFFVQEET